ncbi:hypothetical protein GCM10009038_29790 [Salinicola rhizosphaerae]|uniref:Uncharacterized protein n=1 Tax=Salinicola rhizosphaerae TaxID=1443141 RepID=A0ABQ3EFJ0_9GAMM|nr:hypothetical protein GCM10009038_29790 [Salinicola rhizosphaerae]
MHIIIMIVDNISATTVRASAAPERLTLAEMTIRSHPAKATLADTDGNA